MNLTEDHFRRVAQLLSYEQPLEEIHARLTADGMSEEDFFLCYAAGARMLTWQTKCEHGVPKKLERHMRESFFRPDTERCAQCRKNAEEDAEREEARLDAFLARLKKRREAESA